MYDLYDSLIELYNTPLVNQPSGLRTEKTTC